MKILLILDPLNRLNVSYDSSLAMIRAFTKRGHTCFFADVPDLFINDASVKVHYRGIRPLSNSMKFKTGKVYTTRLKKFDAVLVRKEPPFNMSYIYMTYLLELAARDTLILNDPRALRDTNEKLSTLEFSGLMPKTVVSRTPDNILEFQKKLKRDLILKPLDERGGRGISILKSTLSEKEKIKQIQALSLRGQLPIMAQEFISKTHIKADKRIFLLEGRFLAAYERRFAPGDFRGNLSQGATHQQTDLSAREKRTLARIAPWIKRKNLHFVGIDLLDGLLLEINVTCPGGFPEAHELYPKLRVFEKFAESVEKLSRMRTAV